MTKEETEDYKMLVQRMVRRGLISFGFQALPSVIIKEPKRKIDSSVKIDGDFVKCPACGKTVFVEKNGVFVGRRYCEHSMEGGTRCRNSGEKVES